MGHDTLSERKGAAMSWKDSKDARAGAEFFRLKDDGDHGTIIVVGEPRVVKRRGMMGGDATRYYLPVLTPGGLKTWDMSGKTLDVLAAIPDGGFGERFVVTRRGKAGDTNTVYEITPKPLSAEEKDRLVRSGKLLADSGIAPGDQVDGEDDTIPF